MALCGAVTLSAAGTDRRVLDAARAGEVTAVRTLLRQRAPSDAREPDGTTALHWAVRGDDVEMVDALLEAGARVDVETRYGVAPLTLAATNGNAAIVSRLLKAGANANTVSGEGEPVLMTAARGGRTDVVDLLLSAGADPNLPERWQGETALMWAAGENHADVVKLLATRGADLNAYSRLLEYPDAKVDFATMVFIAVPKGHFTALSFAARQGAVASARALLDAGADINAADPDGTTPLVLAIINAHYDIAELLIDRGADVVRADAAGMGPLYAAVDMLHQEPLVNRPFATPTGRLGARGMIELLLDKGADPNATLKTPLLMRQHNFGDASLGEGATPLMRAAKAGDADLMRLLLDRGADVNRAMKNRTTALMVAASRPGRGPGAQAQTMAVLDLLRARGADLNAANANGETALHLAVSRGDELVTWLVEHGARLDATDKAGRTPLDVALGVPGAPGRGRGGAAAEKPPVFEKTAALLRGYMDKAGESK